MGFREQAKEGLGSQGRLLRDTLYEDKLKEKELQHKHLQEASTAYGYEVVVVHVILEFCGIMFKTAQSAQTLGVEKVRVNRVMNNLHAHAITCLNNVVELRRKLERCSMRRRRTCFKHGTNLP